MYIENMAAEIRDLEDQLYQYDHEYRLLEQELASLRLQNSSLKTPGANADAHSPLHFQPRSNLPISPEPALSPEPTPLEPRSVLENEGGDRGKTPAPAASDELPPPRLSSPLAPTPGVPNLPGRSQPPSLPNGSPGLRPSTPEPKADSDELNLEELLPPTIDPGEPMPPPALPAVMLRNGVEAVAPENNLELNLSRIEIPAKLASQSTAEQATIQIATEQVTDMRVVELAFHPSLTRAINLDDRSDDDGLYLVLQPKNERGQVVPVATDLSIVVIDPAREENKGRIGRWDYSLADVQAKLQPIGTNQGIHLTLPWNGPDPKADRVIVFALYKFENGRQVMAEKEILVSSDGSMKTVWAPRVPDGRETAAVAQASYQTQTPASQLPTNVIRPAVNSTPISPAPSPK